MRALAGHGWRFIGIWLPCLASKWLGTKQILLAY